MAINRWTDAKGQERLRLIDKEAFAKLNAHEKDRLRELQAEMLEYRNKVASLPLGGLRKLYGTLRITTEDAEQEVSRDVLSDPTGYWNLDNYFLDRGNR